MNYKKYVIEKVEPDLLSALKLMDKKIVKEEMEDKDLHSLEELRDSIIEDFTFCLSTSKKDPFTRRYFEKLIQNENSVIMSVYPDDIEALWVFVYERKGYYSYYIPEDIKEIIRKEFHWKI